MYKVTLAEKENGVVKTSWGFNTINCRPSKFRKLDGTSLEGYITKISLDDLIGYYRFDGNVYDEISRTNASATNVSYEYDYIKFSGTSSYL